MAELRFPAIGTQWRLTTPEPLPAAVRTAVAERIDRYDRAFSRFRADSTVAAARRRAGRHRFPAEAADLFETYHRLHRLTGGAVNPLVGGSLAHLGYGPGRAAAATGGRPAADWTRCRTRGSLLSTDVPVALDLGAAGKGQLADLVLGVLRSHCPGDSGPITVDAGGDIVRHPGTPARAERIGLESPFVDGEVIGAVALTGGALCGSGVRRRRWDGWHHVLDARTGLPVTEVVATWALAGSGLRADAAATALFFVDVAAVWAGFGAAGLRVFADGSAQWWPDPRWEVFG